MENTYKVTVIALTEEAIKNNGVVAGDLETDGLMVIANAGEDAISTGFVGTINAYSFGRGLAKALIEADMYDRFKKGMEDQAKESGLMEGLLAMFARALKEEEEANG